MQLDDAFGDGKAQAGALTAASLVGAVKGVPYLVKGVKGQGLAGVFQIKAGLKAHFFDSDSDFSAERRVFDGVAFLRGFSRKACL